MSIFFDLLLKLIPLNIVIALGYVAARVLGAQKETIAKLLLYIISPVVIFYGVAQTELKPALLLLPVMFFIIPTLICFLFLLLGRLVFKSNDNTKNLLAFMAGSGNAGYFGLPVALLLFGQQALGPVVLCVMGYIVYESTIGFYITARGNHTAKESIMKIIKLPAMYAFALGMIFNVANVPLGEFVTVTLESFKSAYSIFGMMIIGMGLERVNFGSFDFRMLSTSFLAKFVIWPLLMAGIILIDKTFLHLFEARIYEVLFLMSIVPLAANTVTFATELKLHPEKASLAVLLSNVIALFYIPLMVVIFAR